MPDQARSTFIPAPVGWHNAFITYAGELLIEPMPGWIQGAGVEEFDSRAEAGVVYDPICATRTSHRGDVVPMPKFQPEGPLMRKHVTVLTPEVGVPSSLVDGTAVDWEAIAAEWLYRILESEDLVRAHGEGFQVRRLTDEAEPRQSAPVFEDVELEQVMEFVRARLQSLDLEVLAVPLQQALIQGQAVPAALAALDPGFAFPYSVGLVPGH